MSESNSTLTQSQLKELLSYDAGTGVFRWLKVPPRSCLTVGCVAGGKEAGGGWRIKIDGKTYKAHRLAWLYEFGKFPSAFIDHINGFRTDNSLVNLREATNQQNQQNIKKAAKSSTHGVLGATWNCEMEKWCARIKSETKRIHLGYFDSAYEAGQAYLKAKRELHEFNTL